MGLVCMNEWINEKPTTTKRYLVPIPKLSTISSTKRPVTGNCTNELKTLKFGFINIRSLSTKALLINNLITEHKLDMIGLCETWLKPNTFLPLNEASPPDYNYAHVARASKQGGGVALIYRSILSLSSNQDIKFTSFEALVLKPSSSNSNSLVQGTGFTWLYCTDLLLPVPRRIWWIYCRSCDSFR